MTGRRSPRHALAWWLIAFGALAPVTGVAAPAKVMVMDLTPNGAPETTAVSATELLAVELSRFGALDVVSGADVRSALEMEAAREATGCDDESSCMAAVAGALGADLVVHGKVGQLGALTLITVHLMQVSEGRSLARASGRVGTLEELPAEMQRVAMIIYDTGLRARGVTLPAKMAATSVPPPTGAPRDDAQAAPADARAMLAELEALAARGAGQELLASATLVPPTSRTPKWEALVATAAADVLSERTKTDAMSAVSLDEDLNGLFPSLRRAPPYQQARKALAREAFPQCFRQSRALAREGRLARARVVDCAAAIETYVARGPADKALDLELARLIRRNQQPWVAIPMFARAVTLRGDAACTDGDVRLAVVSGLYHPPDSDVAKKAKHLGFDLCFDALRTPLKKELARAGQSTYFENACPALVERKALGRLATKRCQRKMRAK